MSKNLAPCSKVGYRDRITALLALETIGRSTPRASKEPCRAYRCPHCKKWHLTARKVWS